jgi:hypothetical protein
MSSEERYCHSFLVVDLDIVFDCTEIVTLAQDALVANLLLPLRKNVLDLGLTNEWLNLQLRKNAKYAIIMMKRLLPLAT